MKTLKRKTKSKPTKTNLPANASTRFLTETMKWIKVLGPWVDLNSYGLGFLSEKERKMVETKSKQVKYSSGEFFQNI